MPRLPISLLLAFSAVSAFSAGPTENPSLRHAPAYGSDEKWWKCDAVEPKNGCDTGTFNALGLTKEEQAFVRDKLDRIAWRPNKVEKSAVSNILGAKPSVDIGVKQIYTGVGVGADPNRAVSVYYDGGSVFMVHWYQPGRFLLVKASSF